jgi:CheY-like chemotaxis protein
MEKYCKSWFGFNTCYGYDERTILNADLIIKQNSFGNYHASDTPPIREPIRMLIIHDGSTPPSGRRSREQNRGVQSIGGPVGPYKLARALLEIFREQLGKSFSDTDISTADAFSEVSAQNSVSSVSLPPSREEVNVEYDPGASIHEPIKTQSLETSELTPQAMQLHQSISLKGTATSPGLEHALQDVTAFSYSTAPASSSSFDGTQASLHLLAVDDNPLNLQLLHRYLLKRKLDTVIVARNGIEAFTAVREAKTPFDIIFMDISMPEMDGFEATRLIRTYERSVRQRELTTEIIKSDSSRCQEEMMSQETTTDPSDSNKEEAHRDGNSRVENEARMTKKNSHHAYIVALTGLASRRDRDKAEESGFDDYLTKPISFSKIGELLARLSAEKAGLL